MLQQYGVLVVSAIVLLEQIGLPIPAFPILIVAGALSVGCLPAWMPGMWRTRSRRRGPPEIFQPLPADAIFIHAVAPLVANLMVADRTAGAVRRHSTAAFALFPLLSGTIGLVA